MNVAAYAPLALADLVVLAVAVRQASSGLAASLGLLGMALGFTVACLCGLRETRRNAEPVLKAGKKAPFVIPGLMFFTPALASVLVLCSRKVAALAELGPLLAVLLAGYSAGIAILIRGLRRGARRADAREGGQTAFAGSARFRGRWRLLLVNPVNSDRFGLSRNASSVYPPLGLGILAALTPKEYSIDLIDENMERFSHRDADIVGITAFTSSAPRAYEIAGLYRERGIPVVMGGIHASMRPDEALERVDTVVTGEAESVWPRLLEDFSRGKLARRYDGGRADIARVPKVDRSLFSTRYLFGTLQTSRGCPMDCYFCSVSAFNGRSFRQRPVDQVLDELAGMEQRMVFFVDDNLIGYGPEHEARAIRLFKGMIHRGIKKEWFAQVSLNFGNNSEVPRWAAESGCRMVFIGLESPDQEELNVMRKGINRRMEFGPALKRIRSHGISVLGAFIFGSDAESRRTLEAKTRFSLSSGVDAVQTTILTPLPGTRQYEELVKEGRLRFTDYPRDWARYDMTELTYSLRNMEEAEFSSALRRSQAKLYSMPTLLWKFLRTLFGTRSMSAALWAWGSNMNYRMISRLHRPRRIQLDTIRR